jgi:trehalose 6-phosphate synthase/phosphatase
VFLQLPLQEEGEEEGASIMVPAKLEQTDNVILVAYQLPLVVQRREGGGFDVEWDDNSVLNKFALNLPLRVRWVGCVGITVEKEEEEALAELLLEEYDCVVVFLDETLVQDFYHGFCRSYLRPILHCQICMPTEEVRSC